MKRLVSPALLRPRPMELGKIKIGGKGRKVQKDDGTSFHVPERYDHFVVTTRRRGDDENFVLDEAVHAVVGKEPRELDVRLMFDEVEESFQSQMVVYKGRTRAFECDGESGSNLKTGETRPCVRAAGGECPCKPFGRLAVILEAAQIWGGFYVFRTTSWESVANIQSQLAMYRQQFGSLRGLPLRLVVYPVTGEHGTNHKVGLVLRASYEEARAAALGFAKADQIAKKELKQLAAGVAEAVVVGEASEAGDIEDEFFPPPEAEADRENGEVQSATRQRIEQLREEIQEQHPETKVFTGAEAEAAEESADQEAGPEPPPENGHGPKQKLTKRYFAALKERFPYPGDDDRRHEWQEYVTAKASTKKWTIADFEAAIAALEARKGFDLWDQVEDTGDGLPF